MNSPSHFRNPGFPINHQSRFVPKISQQSNFYLPKTPMMAHHQSMASPVNHIASFNNIPRTQTFTQISENKVKAVDLSHKNSSRNTPNRSIQTKYFPSEQKTSDISQCSIKQNVQGTINEEFNNKLNGLTDKISNILLRLTDHDQKIRQLQQRSKQVTTTKQSNSKASAQKMQSMIWKAVQRQVNESHQHFTLQQRLIKADIDTLKLQILCYANKKDITQKIDNNDKILRCMIKQLQQNIKDENEKIGERRKKDIQRFQKQLEDIKVKLMDIVFHQETRQAKDRVCLIKCLSFKVMHQMRVYNQEQLKWIEMGTGETVYGLDQEGYLLDNQNKYITDHKGAPVRLQPLQIQLLKNYGLTR